VSRRKKARGLRFKNTGFLAFFKGAISANGSLNLVIETTPFAVTFPASEIIAVFESVNGREGISVNLFARQTDGSEKKIGGFAAQSQAEEAEAHQTDPCDSVPAICRPPSK
jgi:hypothetical protein